MEDKEEEIFVDIDEIEYPYDVIKYDDPYEVMHMNLSIPKPANLPGPLSELFDLLESYYREGKYLHFETEVESMEGLAKNYYMVGAISKNDLKTIFKIFGWPW